MMDEIAQDFDQVGWDSLAGCLSECQSMPAFAGWENAHNAVAYRFRAAAAADDRFTISFADAGQRYAQEEALFAFFFNSASCVECFLFGLYHIGALVEPKKFPIGTDKQLRAISRDAVKNGFNKAFPNDSLTSLIKSIVDDGQFSQMREFRDVLTHRGSIPRQHYVVVSVPGARQDPSKVFVTGKPKSASNAVGLIPLEASTTNQMRKWLADRLRELLSETIKFCEARLA